MLVRVVVLALALVATTAPAARADPPPPRSGKDLLDTVPEIATFDGSWSIALQASTFLVTKTWSAPYPHGILAQEATRVLYGTTWTAMLAGESLLAVVASGGRFDWIAEATYRTDWLFGLTVPAPCPRTGAYGGCGVGVGGFGGIHVRPLGSHVWYEVGGGWIEQRVATDARRTLAESAWAMTPIAAAYELKTDERAPVAIRAQIGPGLYFGMHAAHLHPTLAGGRGDAAHAPLSAPWTELYPLDGGGGPGARAEVRLIFARRVSFDGEITVAPLFLGGVTTSPSHDLAPLDGPRGGIPTWRSVAAGIGFDAPAIMPMRVGIALFGAELSGRPVTDLGHQGMMLRFEFPLRIPRAMLSPR